MSPLQKKCPLKFISGHLSCHTDVVTPNAYGTPQRTSIEEISLCGCYIETMFTFEVSTRVDLVIWLNQEKVTAKGIVVNRYPQVGNGIDFVTMAPQDRLKLNDFISKSSE